MILGGDAPIWVPSDVGVWGTHPMFIYHDSDKGNVKSISGSPADGKAVEGTGYDSTCVPALKFITALNDTGRMLFYEKDDGRSEKDCMWEEY